MKLILLLLLSSTLFAFDHVDLTQRFSKRRVDSQIVNVGCAYGELTKVKLVRSGISSAHSGLVLKRVEIHFADGTIGKSILNYSLNRIPKVFEWSKAKCVEKIVIFARTKNTSHFLQSINVFVK